MLFHFLVAFLQNNSIIHLLSFLIMNFNLFILKQSIQNVWKVHGILRYLIQSEVHRYKVFSTNHDKIIYMCCSVKSSNVYSLTLIVHPLSSIPNHLSSIHPRVSIINHPHSICSPLQSSILEQPLIIHPQTSILYLPSSILNV